MFVFIFYISIPRKCTINFDWLYPAWLIHRYIKIPIFTVTIIINISLFFFFFSYFFFVETARPTRTARLRMGNEGNKKHNYEASDNSFSGHPETFRDRCNRSSLSRLCIHFREGKDVLSITQSLNNLPAKKTLERP